MIVATVALGATAPAGRAAVATTGHNPLDVVLAIDDSASEFSGPGTDVARVRYRAALLAAEILAATSTTGAQDRVGVVHFGSQAPVKYSLSPVAVPSELRQVAAAIGSPMRLGTTNFMAAIDRAGGILGPSSQGRRKVILMVSDGQPFVRGASETMDFQSIAAQVKAERARLDLLGIDRTAMFAGLVSRWSSLTTCAHVALRNPTTKQLTTAVAQTLACEERVPVGQLACAAVAPAHRALVAAADAPTLKSICERNSMADHSPLALGIAGGVIVVVLLLLCFLPWGGFFRGSLLHKLIVGADNRTSTSKTVALAWTLAIFYMLTALLIAKWLGTEAGWTKLNDKGIQDAYLILLGGPYAAAVLAKLSATAKSNSSPGSGGKTVAAPGTATVSQLVSDDQGNTDIADLQYVLFNGITLVYVLVTFVGNLQMGLPDIPQVLTGLALTSAGGYTASKLVTSDTPVVTSISSLSAPLGGTFDILGSSLIVPRGTKVAGEPADALPQVTIGGVEAEYVRKGDGSASGYDDVQVTVASNTPTGPNQAVVVTRFDGVLAQTRSGTPLVLTVTPSASGIPIALIALNRLATARDG